MLRHIERCLDKRHVLMPTKLILKPGTPPHEYGRTLRIKEIKTYFVFAMTRLKECLPNSICLVYFGKHPANILFKSVTDCYRPDRCHVGPITVRYIFGWKISWAIFINRFMPSVP